VAGENKQKEAILLVCTQEAFLCHVEMLGVMPEMLMMVMMLLLDEG
jgi:hypothetical protein